MCNQSKYAGALVDQFSGQTIWNYSTVTGFWAGEPIKTKGWYTTNNPWHVSLQLSQYWSAQSVSSCPLPGAPHSQRWACLSTPPAVTQTFPKNISSTSAWHRSRWMLCQSPICSASCCQTREKMAKLSLLFKPLENYWSLAPFLSPYFKQNLWEQKKLEGYPPLQSVKTRKTKETGKRTEKRHTACHL